MAIPVYKGAGTASGATGACGLITVTPSYPTVAAGDFLLLFVAFRSGTLVSLNSVPNGWSLFDSEHDGGPDAYYLIYKFADGSETGSVSLDATYSGATPRGLARIYSFTGVNTTTPVGDLGAETSGTGTSHSAPSITTTDTNVLACAVAYKRAPTTLSTITGESGGDWTEPVAETGASNITLAISTSSKASIGSITGGSATWGATGQWYSLAFSIFEADAAAAPPPPKPFRHLEHLLIR